LENAAIEFVALRVVASVSPDRAAVTVCVQGLWA